MSAHENLSPHQFDNEHRRTLLTTAKSVPGREAPVVYANESHRYIPNPLAAHIPEPIREDHPDGDGSYTTRSQSGLRPYDRTDMWERPRGVQRVPLDRLESTQGYVSRTHVSNMARRKGEAPPIEVTHHTDSDRYMITEGNHRALVALKRGQVDIPAEVTRRIPWNRPEQKP